MPSLPREPDGRNLLAGKRVVVTAAAGTGIGSAVAKRCLVEGARVFISDIHERRLGETADRLEEETGSRPLTQICNVTEEADVQAESGRQAVVATGLYVLQAGSFTEYEDADRRRATLALQGIESKIQRVTIDDNTYHRVRIGPIDDLTELNVLRSRLREAQIDVLRIRLGD